jgi:hypothetical protein
MLRHAIGRLSSAARDQRGVRIDGDNPHVRIERGAGCPFGGEVERLAEQHNQVGALDDIGEGAERGIGDATRTLHDDGGCADRGFELSEQRTAAHAGQLRAGDDDGACAGRDGGEDFVGRCIIELCRRWLCRVRPNHGTLVHSGIEQIGRQAQVHWSGPARCRDADRFGDVAAERVRRARCP